MATAQTHEERRHIPDRRANSTTAASHGLSTLDWVATTLLIIGGLNWGLVGLFSFDLVAAIFGEMSALSRVVYTLVGLSAIYCIFMSTKLAKKPDS